MAAPASRPALLQTLPPRREKLHYTFDDRSLIAIGRTNFVLLNKLNSIATRRPEPKLGAPPARPPQRLRTPAEIAREKAQREIDRGNVLLLRKLQATKPAVTAGLATSGVRGAGGALPREAWTSPARDARPRPEWHDPMSSLPPRPPRASMGGGGGGGGLGRRTMFRPGADVAVEASREDHLYE